MNILLTGGLGFIGSHCVLDLLKNNHNPIIIDNCSTCKEITLNRIEKLSQKKLNFHKIDLINLSDIERVFLNNPYMYRSMCHHGQT